MGRLDGKVAIITGAAQGIGAAYARRFAAEGAPVVLADMRGEKAAEVAASINGAGGTAMAVTVDVADEQSTRDCVKQTLDAHGRVDILVNNAGLYFDLDMADTTHPYLRKVMDVNLYGPILMTRAVLKPMRLQGGGVIINQASTAAYMYTTAAMAKMMNPGAVDDIDSELPLSPYSISKAAVTQLTKFLAGGLGQYGIRVNCIAPGTTMTEATKTKLPENILGMLSMFTALGKTLEPEDLCGPAVFLASDDSAMVTGQTLVVDAGQFMLG
jgi:3-oxoacyl-[acyl-carrier protein] reductase